MFLSIPLITFVFKTELKIVEVAIVLHLKGGDAEEAGQSAYLFVCNGMLHDNDCIVNVATLDQAVIEKEFNLMEENEGAAYTDFIGIDNLRIPQCMLNSENA